MIKKIKKGQFADGLIEDPFGEDNWVEFENPDAAIFPMNDVRPKRNFVRSENERKLVNRYVQMIKRGQLVVKSKDQIRAEREAKKNQIWDIWKDESLIAFRSKSMPPQINAPKKPLPQHAESYNPSKEFLLTDEEKKEQDELDPEDRLYNFSPQTFEAL